MYLPADRVRPLGISMMQAMSIVKAIGVGSAPPFATSTLHYRAQAIENKRKALSSEVSIPAARRTDASPASAVRRSPYLPSQ